MDEKYHINKDCFDTESEKRYYWLGFLYGDGYINGNRIQVALAAQDKDHLIKLSAFIGRKNRPLYKKKNNAFEFKARFTLALPVLNYFEITTNKGFRTENVIKKISKGNKRHFIRGLFDADGCLGVDSGNRKFVELTGRYNLMSWIKDFLIEEKIMNNDSIIYKNGSIFRLRLKKGENIKFLNYIYDNSNIFLDRKMLRYKNMFKAE